MDTTHNTKILRIVRTVLNILFGLLVIVSLFLVLWIILSPFILRVTDITITSSVPVAVGKGADPSMEVVIAGAELKGIPWAFVDQAQGTLRLETTNWYLIFISNLAKLLTASGLAYLIYLLRSVVIALQQGEVFSPANVTRIRRIGYLVLVLALLQAAVEYFAAYEFFRQLTIISPPLSLPSPFEPGVILASLLILALAQVWSYGLELEQERALTI
jgi:hypothetical protein